MLSADYQGQNLQKGVNQISTRKQLYSIEVSFRPASIFILFLFFWGMNNKKKIKKITKNRTLLIRKTSKDN